MSMSMPYLSSIQTSNIPLKQSVADRPNLNSPHNAQEVYLTRRTVTSGGLSGRANRSSRADLGTDSTLAG
jgi:hypothetical protein